MGAPAPRRRCSILWVSNGGRVILNKQRRSEELEFSSLIFRSQVGTRHARQVKLRVDPVARSGRGYFLRAEETAATYAGSPNRARTRSSKMANGGDHSQIV
ncbi:hypothetical protein Bbelb_011970 [Branchiostoma belcheri]|nr:hypothetical protein Bbelb_011970 [Branchiostoma belcheri]